MTVNTTPRRVDQTGLKTGQALTIVLLLAAFVLDAWLLVALVALAQLMGALALPFAPYRLFYQHVVKPTGVVKPNVQPDNPEPHRFAHAGWRPVQHRRCAGAAGRHTGTGGGAGVGRHRIGEPQLLAELLPGLLDVLSVQPPGTARFYPCACPSGEPRP
ncbi:DUF4395 domain-containing protein [bacterium]|nr:DUF4395 domain-containing protein [bacterium]